MTTYDNITISATFIYMTEDKFRCESKLKKLAKREGFENAKKRMQKDNGCGVYRQGYRYDIDGIRYHECLCGFRSHSMGMYLDLEDQFSRGILPFEGSYMDQPAKIIEIMARVTSLKLDKKERDYKEQEKQSKRDNKAR